MNTNMVVVKGSGGSALRKGPGFYDRSPLPGVPGTIAIAGHRTTFLAPFRHIDRLRAGDTITLRMPYATFTYRVDERRIVKPNATWITRRTGYDRLVLSACHPLFSAAQRIVVSARLRSTVPA
jgi:sortase A